MYIFVDIWNKFGCEPFGMRFGRALQTSNKNKTDPLDFPNSLVWNNLFKPRFEILGTSRHLLKRISLLYIDRSTTLYRYIKNQAQQNPIVVCGLVDFQVCTLLPVPFYDQISTSSYILHISSLNTTCNQKHRDHCSVATCPSLQKTILQDLPGKAAQILSSL